MKCPYSFVLLAAAVVILLFGGCLDSFLAVRKAGGAARPFPAGPAVAPDREGDGRRITPSAPAPDPAAPPRLRLIPPGPQLPPA
jgi:hypothetical protein